MNLPQDFSQYTLALMGQTRYDRFLRALDEPPTVAIRLNPAKLPAREASVEGNGGQVPWCEDAWYLASRPDFTFDPMLHAGVYYVQEASSMFLHRVLRQHVSRPVVALDLCAAPGGKSTVARSALPQGSLLFCNEPMRDRSRILAENMMKWGHPDVVVTNDFPKAYRESGLRFDVIVADVPCSGEGMFRKDPASIAEWSRQHVFDCAKLQREIVSDAWRCLRPGGLLVYSTCTFNAQEDEENVAWMIDRLGAEPLTVDVEADWAITGSLAGDLPVYRFIPGYTRGEGLFMAVLRKPEEQSGEEKPPRKTKNSRREKPGKPFSVPADWLRADEEMAYSLEEDTLRVIPQRWFPLYRQARERLRVLHAGVTMGTLKGRDLLPHQSLALSTLLHQETFPAVDLTWQQAVAYLRKEAFPLPADTPRGFTLLTYGRQPLGFAKNIGQRANNLYPQEWRVKSTHLPPAAPQVVTLP